MYTVSAVADDGTGFRFSGPSYYGSEGTRIKVKYSKSNPARAYGDIDLWEMLVDRFQGVNSLIFFVITLVWVIRKIMYPTFTENLKRRRVTARGLYLPVLETCSYEEKTERGPRGRHNKFSPVYRYAMPDGAELLFRGMWTRDKPEGALANRYTEFRVYMMDPEDHKNNEYFIKEISRQV